MNVLEAILGANNGEAVHQLGSQFGLSEDKANAALASLVPALAAGFQRNAASSGGLDSLLTALAAGGHARYVDDPTTLSQPDAVEEGNGILGHVFGSKEVSRQVATRAAAQTGIGADVLKQMLPMVAALMMGTLARQAPSTSVSAPAAGATSGSSLINMLSSTLDRNRDGSMIDDVMGMLGALSR
ncbi:MAG: DUF937 domain-containing protein [Betaproteobacteria bacterium]